ncbi:MAG: transcriptional regulator MntR [Nitrososphaerales archaeon]
MNIINTKGLSSSSKSINESTRLTSIRNANSSKKYTKDRTPRMEDYLEVIYELVQSKGYATTVDISQYLNVSSPSVTKMVQRLDEAEMLIYEKYRGIRLTEHGISIAVSIRNRHGLLSEFFRLIGVDENTANEDAEGLEHHLHPESIKKLEKFVNIMKNNPDILNI